MSARTEERRTNPNPFDIAGVLAILYTIGYLVMVGLLYFVGIPLANKDPLLQLFGLMSAIQMALIGFYFGGSKQVEATQRAAEQSKARAETVVQEIAKTVPIAAAVAAGTAAAGTVTPAPTNPETGVIPAAEVHPTGDTAK